MVIASLQIMYPMLFQLSDEQGQYKTHAGVLEFVAEEGRAYLPRWMMKTLHLHEGAFIRVVSTSLELGTFVKLQPQSVDSTLTVGDVISIKYNDKVYDILVMELKPADGVSVVETDIQVDFAPPVGYVEPTVSARKPAARSSIPCTDTTRLSESTCHHPQWQKHRHGSHLQEGAKATS
jgi:hypothetical protein